MAGAECLVVCVKVFLRVTFRKQINVLFLLVRILRRVQAGGDKNNRRNWNTDGEGVEKIGMGAESRARLACAAPPVGRSAGLGRATLGVGDL